MRSTPMRGAGGVCSDGARYVLLPVSETWSLPSGETIIPSTCSSCEGCGHALGTAPDVERIRNELRKQRRTFLLSGFVLLGFVALDIAAVEQGATSILICVPAVAGLVWSGYRCRVLAAWLVNASS